MFEIVQSNGPGKLTRGLQMNRKDSSYAIAETIKNDTYFFYSILAWTTNFSLFFLLTFFLIIFMKSSYTILLSSSHYPFSVCVPQKLTHTIQFPIKKEIVFDRNEFQFCSKTTTITPNFFTKDGNNTWTIVLCLYSVHSPEPNKDN